VEVADVGRELADRQGGDLVHRHRPVVVFGRSSRTGRAAISSTAIVR